MSLLPSLTSEREYLQHSTDCSDGHPDSGRLSNKLPLPFSSETLHPDDAKDKVFAAILKALVILDNKPSSPKELANCIMKHKLTLLGGATPYATVSSRISQHFKRAMEHKPPRTPLLARIVDENHSRKIHYYIANEAIKTDLHRLTTIPSPQPTLKPRKELTSVEGGYPKLKIRLKKRKNSMMGTHVFKRYKTMLSGSGTRPGMGMGMGRGKGKWAPHTHYRSPSRVCRANSSGGGSDADIDEVESDSDKESVFDELPAIESTIELTSGTHPSPHLEPSTPEPSRELPLDGEYSDYFEEMMNGDWWIDSYDADTQTTKQDQSAGIPSAQRTQPNPTTERPMPAPFTATPHTPIRRRNEMDLGTEPTPLLTPDTASLFGREFDTHLIPNFGDEFTTDPPYVPLMELNNPEMLPMSELDELLCDSPRKHDTLPRHPLGEYSVNHGTSLHSTSDIVQGSNEFRYDENHDHQVPSREGETGIEPFNASTDTSLMDVDIRPSNSTRSSPVKHVSAESVNGVYPMLLTLEENVPLISTKVYANIKVYEVALPEAPFRLMRFHSNVPQSNGPQNHGIILEESRHKDFCNASLLRKAAQTYVSHGRSERSDAYTRFVVIRNGPPECRGVWVSLERARQLVEEYGIQNVPHIQQLLSNDPLSGHHESVYDPIEMDKHLVELSGILGNPASGYNFSQGGNQNDTAAYHEKPDTQSGITDSVDPCIDENEDIDTNTYISLDQDDEHPNLLDSPSESSGFTHSTSSACEPNPSDGVVEEKLKKSLVPTQIPTTPAIYLTVIESVPVYITYLSSGPNNDETIQLMRRFDSGYVNGTKLLMLGGVETESERTIVLSLEVGRVRVRKVESKLFGTWIPLPRARALASTCSLQHKLGPFLDDKLSSYFSRPLPSFTAPTKPMGLTSRLHQVLKAKASTLPARNAIGSTIGISPQSLHPSKNYFSGPNHHIYQILGLQGSKQSKSAALSGIFGGPTVVSAHDEKKWSKKVKSRFVNGKRALKTGQKMNHLKSDSTPTTVDESIQTKEETESDIELERVRKTIQIQRLSDPELPVPQEFPNEVGE